MGVILRNQAVEHVATFSELSLAVHWHGKARQRLVLE